MPFALDNSVELIAAFGAHRSVVEDVPLVARRPTGKTTISPMMGDMSHQGLVGAALGNLSIMAYGAAKLVLDGPQHAVRRLLEFEAHVKLAVPTNLGRKAVHGPEALQVQEEHRWQPQESRTQWPEEMLHGFRH